MARATPKPRLTDDQLRFGMMWQSSPTPTTTSGAVADTNPDPLDPAEQMALARAAEDAGLDYVFMADGYIPHGENSGRIGHAEPHLYAPVFAPVIMAATQHLGVVTTVHTRYLSPAVIARIGASMDALSNGRWGWNIVPGSKIDESTLLGVGSDSDHDLRYEMAEEALDAVKALWAARGEHVEFHGRFHDLSGKMIGPHIVQEPWPCLFNAGVSPRGQELIASTCDFAFTPLPADHAKVSSTVQSINDRTRAHGRSPLEVNLAGATGMVVAPTEQEAADKYAWIQETLDMDGARDIATELMGASQTYQENYEGEFDEIARTLGVAHGSMVLVGTPESLAEQLLEVHRETGVRGFMLLPTTYTAQDMSLMGDIFPYLQKAGVWTPPAERGWSW